MKEKYYLVKIEPTENGTFAMHLHPQLEVAPIVHAHWISDGKDPYDERANLFVCSKCGLGRSFHTNPPAYNYCPWCGAKMDEEVTE